MTAVETPTITGFLLARIAEDEAMIRRAYEHRQDRFFDLGEVAGDFPLVTMHEASVLAGDPFNRPERKAIDRLSAECEAKRKIVETFRDVDASVYLLLAEKHTEGATLTQGVASGLKAAMCFLALPYADHPDFRPEWRAGG